MTPLTDAEVIGQCRVDDFHRFVGEIYGAKDELRSLWDVWLHANHHAAAVAQAVRGPSIQERVIKETADLAFWLLTIVHRVRGDLGVKRRGEDERQSIVRVKENLS